MRRGHFSTRSPAFLVDIPLNIEATFYWKTTVKAKLASEASPA
jgi:hypothetical protein